MPLTMRPTGLGSEIDKDRADYTVYCGGWNVGRIYETRGGPDSLRWFWSLKQTERGQGVPLEAYPFLPRMVAGRAG